MVIGSRCGRRAAADVQGTGGKQEQGKVSSPLRRRCAVIGTVLVKKKALTSVQGPEVGVSLLSL